MSDPAPAASSTTTTAWHTLSADDALAAQGVTAGQGLSAAEVTARRAKYGPNKRASPASWSCARCRPA
jgi:Ca2+-transporting ATPase